MINGKFWRTIPLIPTLCGSMAIVCALSFLGGRHFNQTPMRDVPDHVLTAPPTSRSASDNVATDPVAEASTEPRQGLPPVSALVARDEWNSVRDRKSESGPDLPTVGLVTPARFMAEEHVQKDRVGHADPGRWAPTDLGQLDERARPIRFSTKRDEGRQLAGSLENVLVPHPQHRNHQSVAAQLDGDALVQLAREPSAGTGALPPSSRETASNGLTGPLGSTQFVPAEQPKADQQWEEHHPGMSAGAFQVPYVADDFSPDPVPWTPYDAASQQWVYSGKTLNANQRPLIELGQPWYQLGPIAPGQLWLGRHNPVHWQFLVYGDFRSGFASNTTNGNQQSVWAMRWNLDFDLRITSTERFHWFMGPLDRGGDFTRVVHDGGETHFVSEFDPDLDFGYFEGDVGAIWGGLSHQTLPFDLPFAVGVMPLLFQNGVWMEEAFLGWATTLPARNSPGLDISNMDITFFGGYDNITSDAFPGDNHAAKMHGIATFVEAYGGYLELDYAFLEDRTSLDRSYHNTSIAFTRRFGRFVSNSLRMINNAGQSPAGVEQTADGTLLLFENSLITSAPSTFVPYLNGFVGFDRPQSAARAAASGGVLRNTGILFETDGLTGYPTLDAGAQNTYGAAVGLNMIARDFSQQWIVEAAMVQPMSQKQASISGEQFGLGMRYQLPLSNSVILRLDGMYGWDAVATDLQGYRIELRKKW